MRETDLPSPGIGGKGHQLRRDAARAISQLEIASTGYNAGGTHPAGSGLRAFFQACADACISLDATPSNPQGN